MQRDKTEKTEREDKVKMKFQIEDQVVLITGGSQGLGRELAHFIYKNTENTKIIIISRSKEKLIKACTTITCDDNYDILNNYHAGNGGGNRLYYQPCDLSSVEDIETVLEPKLKNIPISMTFFIAGGTQPKLFKDHSLKELSQGVSMNYLSSLYLSKIILNSSCKHLIFFSSVTIFFPFIGYSQYAPLKTALKTLISILRQEYPNRRISMVYPGNFKSEGYKEENRYKPEITKIIEGTSVAISCEECVSRIIKSLTKGYDDITTDTIGWFLMGLDMGLNKNWNKSFLWGLQLFLGIVVNLLVIPIYMFIINLQIKQWLEKSSRKRSSLSSSSSSSSSLI